MKKLTLLSIISTVIGLNLILSQSAFAHPDKNGCVHHNDHEECIEK